MKNRFENIYQNINMFGNKCVTKKNILFFVILLTIVLFIPILWVSFYTHPSADDFNYGVNTIRVLQDKGLFGVMQGSIRTLVQFYQTWQGTYSAIILFTLNPSVFGNGLYFLTTFIILGVFFIGLYFFLRQVLKCFLKLDTTSFFIFFLSFFCLAIETMPDKVQGLYWWNGASYYMIFFSLELLELGLLVKRYFLHKEAKLHFVFLLFLITIIGGGNFITALQQIILLCFLNVYCIFFKKDKSAIPLLVFSLVSFGISALAPGNAYRAASVTSTNPIKAILLSFYFAFDKVLVWMTPFQFIVLLVLAFLLYPTYQNTKFQFKHPFVVLFFFFCIFAAEFTPTLYSTSDLGAGRLWNIMYISYLLFAVFSMYYVIGSIRRKLIDKKVISKKTYGNMLSLLKEYRAILFLVIGGLLFVNFYLGRENMATYQTFVLLKNGDAKKYDMEYKERIKILENDKIKKVEFKELSVYPYPIFYCEFSEDEDSWLNEPITKIYHKDSVKLVKKKVKEEK